jgi:hypothetical protein
MRQRRRLLRLAPQLCECVLLSCSASDRRHSSQGDARAQTRVSADCAPVANAVAACNRARRRRRRARRANFRSRSLPAPPQPAGASGVLRRLRRVLTTTTTARRRRPATDGLSAKAIAAILCAGCDFLFCASAAVASARVPLAPSVVRPPNPGCCTQSKRLDERAS